MIKKIKTIQRIKRLKNSRPDDDFLYSFRDDLKKFMAANPVMEWSAERPNMEERLNMILNDFYYKINKTKLMPIAIVIALIAMLSGGGAALASQNSVPGETLYPVKTLTENVRSVLAISGQSEAKLQSRLAAERLEEVNEMLQADEVDAEGVEIALSKLKEHVARMSMIVEGEKTKGRDVAQLEDDLSNNLKINKDMLERTFKAQKEGIENEKKSLEKEIDAAESNDDENEINELEEKLNALKKKNELLEVKENAVKQEIKDDENEDEDDSDGREKSYLNLEWKLAAVKAMKEAEKEKNGLLSKASSSGVTIDGKYFKQYDDFMAKASSSLSIGDSAATSAATSTDAGGANYKQAYQFAKQAKEMLGLAEKEYERQDESSKKNEEARKESGSKDDEDGNDSSDDQEENEDKDEDDKDEDDNSRR